MNTTTSERIILDKTPKYNDLEYFSEKSASVTNHLKI